METGEEKVGTEASSRDALHEQAAGWQDGTPRSVPCASLTERYNAPILTVSPPNRIRPHRYPSVIDKLAIASHTLLWSLKSHMRAVVLCNLTSKITPHLLFFAQIVSHRITSHRTVPYHAVLCHPMPYHIHAMPCLYYIHLIYIFDPNAPKRHAPILCPQLCSTRHCMIDAQQGVPG
jgi:hypothetical protein